MTSLASFDPIEVKKLLRLSAFIKSSVMMSFSSFMGPTLVLFYFPCIVLTTVQNSFVVLAFSSLVFQ